MVVYLVNILLILFWRAFFMHLPFKDSNKLFCGIVATQWTLISGLRALNVGSDTYSYAYSFSLISTKSWGDVFRNIFDYLFRGLKVKDPGFPLFVKIFQIFSNDYQLFLLVIAIIFMTLMAIWIYKHSVAPCTSYILFSTLFYAFYAVTGHRQTIATALIVFVGYDLIRERKLGWFLLVTFISSLIHKSSMVFSFLYVITMIPVTKGTKIASGVLVALVFVFGGVIYPPIARWLGYSERQISYSKGGAELYAILLSVLCIVTWIQYSKIEERREDAQFLFHINTMALLTALLTLQNQGFMRIQQYFSLFIMVTIPEVIDTLRTDFRIVGYLLFGMVMILYLVKNNPYYAFFFM